METFLNRYRNVTVLLLVIFAQLVLVAVQVKNDQDVRMIRVWTVSAITPAARVAEWLRGGSIGFVRNYIVLHDTQEANRRLQGEVDRLKIENNFLRNELNTADRAKALAASFMAMCSDPAVIEDGEKLGIEMSPIDGDTVLESIERAAATPRDVIARYDTLVGPAKN